MHPRYFSIALFFNLILPSPVFKALKLKPLDSLEQIRP